MQSYLNQQENKHRVPQALERIRFCGIIVKSLESGLTF